MFIPDFLRQPSLARRFLPATAVLLAAASGAVYLFLVPLQQENRMRQMGLDELRRWVDQNPGVHLGWYYLGQAHENAGAPRAAFHAYTRSLALAPEHARSRARMARLLTNSGRADLAEQLLRDGLAGRPAETLLHAALGQVLEALGQHEKARAEWERVVAAEPGDATAWRQLGHCRAILKDEKGAVRAYERAVAVDPENPEARKGLAEALRLLGDLPRAEEHARKAAEIAPQDAPAFFVLGKVLRERGGATKEAEDMMRRAAHLGPDNPLHCYSLAGILQERGDARGAIRAYREAHRLFTSWEPTATAAWSQWDAWLTQMEAVHFNLSACYRRVADSRAADQHLARFRQLSDYHNAVRRLHARIASRPGDRSLQEQLRNLHRAAGFPQLVGAQDRIDSRSLPGVEQ